jgi:hypothetical protein
LSSDPLSSLSLFLPFWTSSPHHRRRLSSSSYSRRRRSHRATPGHGRSHEVRSTMQSLPHVSVLCVVSALSAHAFIALACLVDPRVLNLVDGAGSFEGRSPIRGQSLMLTLAARASWGEFGWTGGGEWGPAEGIGRHGIAELPSAGSCHP